MNMIFWVEASHNIGTGHFMESLILADYLINQKMSVNFIVNPYQPAELELQNRNIPYSVIEINDYDKVFQLIQNKSNSKCAIINHRDVSINALKLLHQNGCFIVVIDQLGKKQIICDVLINRSIVSKWLVYKFLTNKPVCCFGADYAILKECCQKLYKEDKYFLSKSPTILVTMGGVDRTGATLRILKALQSIKYVNKEIIVGKGFVHLRQLQQSLKEMSDSSFHYYQGINNLEERMKNSDIVISAGGNTLYEMACVGTPGIVLWEDDHERIQAKAFSEKGIIQFLGNGISTPIEDISKSIHKLLNSPELRKKMSQCGKKLVDPFGSKRIFNKIYKLTKKENSF